MTVNLNQDRNWILLCAFMQGICLLALHRWVEALPQPDQLFGWIWPAYAWSLLLPTSLQVLASHRRQRGLWLWLGLLAAVLATMAAYEGWSIYVPNREDDRHYWVGPAFVLGLSLFTVWFVSLSFVQFYLLRGSLRADYPFLFASTWRNGLQFGSAAVFVGVFWGLLGLCTALFNLVGIHFFADLFSQHSFIYPFTATVFGLGLAVYQVREAAMLNLYRASLNVLGWLLPVAAFLAMGFLFTLAFTGLHSLWHTGHATALLLALQGVLLLLFNAAWQDGTGETPLPPSLHQPLAWAMGLLPAYSLICAYSLGLRVQQYGWSGERVWAALLVLMVGFYVFGYARAACLRGPWMAGVGKVNTAGAGLLLILLIASASPLLDPERIGVASQMSRLLSGQTKLAEFDFRYLRFEAGRLGNEGLQTLAQLQAQGSKAEIRQKALLALEMSSRYNPSSHVGKPWTAENVQRILQVYPQGSAVEDSFLQFLVGEHNHKHSAYLGESNLLLGVDLNADGRLEYVLFGENYGATVFAFRAEQGWGRVGTLFALKGWLSREDIKALKGDLEAGRFRVKDPEWRNLEIGERVLGVGR